MKKLAILFLAMALLLTLAACGNEETQPTKPSDTKPVTAPSDPTAAPTEPTDAPTQPPHVHSFGDWTETAPTCDAAGSRERTCDCGEKETESIPALGHSWAEATCDKAKTCTVCGATEGEALGHSYENGTCKRCDAKDPIVTRLEEGKWMAYSPFESDIIWKRLIFSNGTVWVTSDEGMNILQFSPEIQEEIKEYEPARILEYNGGLYVMPVASWSVQGTYTIEGDQIIVEIVEPEYERFVLRIVDNDHLEMLGGKTVYTYETNEHKHYFRKNGDGIYECVECGEKK